MEALSSNIVYPVLATILGAIIIGLVNFIFSVRNELKNYSEKIKKIEDSLSEHNQIVSKITHELTGTNHQNKLIEKLVFDIYSSRENVQITKRDYSDQKIKTHSDQKVASDHTVIGKSLEKMNRSVSVMAPASGNSNEKELDQEDSEIAKSKSAIGDQNIADSKGLKNKVKHTIINSDIPIIDHDKFDLSFNKALEKHVLSVNKFAISYDRRDYDIELAQRWLNAGDLELALLRIEDIDKKQMNMRKMKGLL